MDSRLNDFNARTITTLLRDVFEAGLDESVEELMNLVSGNETQTLEDTGLTFETPDGDRVIIRVQVQ